MAAEKKHCVLFVDDEQRVLKSLKRGLISEPYRALFALSGMEALEILADPAGPGDRLRYENAGDEWFRASPGSGPEIS